MKSFFFALGLGMVTVSASAESLQSRFDQLRHSLHLSSAVVPDMQKPILGIVGDSLAAGSSAALNGGHGMFEPPLRIWDTPETAEMGLRRSLTLAAAAGLDCEECTFLYRLGRAQGLPAQNIFVAAQAGSRSDAIYGQMKRLALPMGYLPQTVVISFTGNDICSMGNLTPDQAALSTEGQNKKTELVNTISTQIRQTIKTLKPAPGGTKIVVLSAADVIEILTNPGILAHRTRLGGTCRDLRYGKMSMINQMCPLLLNTRPEDQNRIDLARTLFRSVVDAQEQAVKVLQEELQAEPRGFQVSFSDQLLGTNFDGDDISDDCFHPSATGHAKLFRQFSQGLPRGKE